ncbi:MAG TPA: hypothetical protein VN256_25875 [Pyrinomonadaceae bacterium]|nr:hypothetical protein [Pyrinomonadaceae bacterium]
MIPARSFKRITFRLFLTAILAVSLLTALPFAWGGAHAQSAPGHKTDRAVYPEPSLPARPAAGGKYTDPVFGTEIMRVTDEADENTVGCSTYYSHWPTFNADGTRLLIRKGQAGEAMVKNFDPATFTLGETIRPRLPQLPDRSSASWESSTWHPTDPDVIYTFPYYYDGGMKLYSYNVKADTFTLVKDFGYLATGSTDYLKQMYVSADGDVFSWLHMKTRAGSGDVVYAYLVWRKSTDRVLAHTVDTYVGGINEVHVDKSGKYLAIPLNQPQPDGTLACFLNLETGGMDYVRMNSTDRPDGHGDLGTGTIVGTDIFDAGIHVRRLNDVHRPEMVFRFKDANGVDDWTQDFHGTMLAHDENWITIGTYDNPNVTLPDSGVFEDELMQVAVDGSGRFRRIAHTRTRYDSQTSTSGYWALPKPSVSRDGRYIAYTSNWEKSGRYDMYIARVQPAGSPDPDPNPTPTPTPAPASPSMVAGVQASASALAAMSAPSAGQINQLATDIQSAYGAFQAEAAKFTSAGEIDVNLRAAYYFASAAAALATAGAPAASIQDRLLIAAERLGRANSVMQQNAAFASLAHASSVVPVIGTTDLRSQASLATSISAGSLGLIRGDATVSPLAPGTETAAQAADGSFPYELSGVSVTVGGRAAQVISVSPGEVRFYLPADVPAGTAELLVTSNDGKVSQGTAAISAVAPAIFTKAGTGAGAAVAFNAATYLSGDFDVATEANFGADKRTRLMLFSTGTGTNVANSNLNNDPLLGVVRILNLAESVQVEARTVGGQTLLLPVEYAGRQNTLPGLDQVVFILPAELKGAGQVELTLIAGGQRSNTATIYVK